jgi:hypothetical protein
MILILSWSLINLGPLGLDKDIYNARDLYTWLVHVLRYREYRLSDKYIRYCLREYVPKLSVLIG